MGDPTKEWRSRREGIGAWIHLSWPFKFKIGKFELFDRPVRNWFNYNLLCKACDSQILLAHVLFDDGTSFEIGPLDNYGAPSVFTFPARNTKSINFTVVNASLGYGGAIGLAEFAVHIHVV